jgi:hypothetical protein
MTIKISKKQIKFLLVSLLILVIIFFIIRVNTGSYSDYGSIYTWSEKGIEYQEEIYYYEDEELITCYSNRWDATKEPEKVPCSTLKNYSILYNDLKRKVMLYE